MIEAIEFWNEPNNLSHWNFRLDPDWRRFSQMLSLAARRSAELAPSVRRVLGGICPIDPAFIARIAAHGALADIDVVGIHGFPIDWDIWPIDEWPDRVAEVEAVAGLPVWVTEVGCASMGAEAVQTFGLQRTTELLGARVERTFWYSLLDLPAGWAPTIAAHEPAHGSNYHRHFHLGLIRDDGHVKQAAVGFDPQALGLCQWFHWHDHRLDFAVHWLKRLQVRRLRTCISWADWHRPGHLQWFDRMMAALEGFDITLILCFTPPSRGIEPKSNSPPCAGVEFAWFTEEVIRRYCLRGRTSALTAAASHPSPPLTPA